ncbi:MAG: hypothetical protein K2F83_02580, partial [Oscillospiraceae bacterium]|nr:hypothetical protein [Oscillospiraceae bacterium]
TETSLGTRWSLRWSDDIRSLTVSATEEGKVLSLNYWDEEPAYYYRDSFRPKFPDMTVAQAKTYAQTFLNKVLTAGETPSFYDSERDYLSATSYTFGGTILLNDTDSPLTFRVRVRLSDGMVTYFSREDVSQYVGGIPAPNTVTTAAHAGELLAGPLNLYVEYVWDYEKEMAVLRYLPGARDDYYVDAATGELINLTELRSMLNQTYNKNGNILFTPEASMDAAMGAESNLQLSQAELEGVSKLEGVLTQEELGAIVRRYAVFGLKDFELVGATFSVQTPDIIILEDGTTKEEETETSVTARLTFAKNTEEGVARRFVTMDGKTGELFSMSGYNPYSEEEPTITEEAAQKTGIDFLTELWPEQVHKTEVYRSYAANYASDRHSFTLCQKENGYFYPANSLSVGVDAATGAVMSFSKSFDDTVTFESPEGMISMEEALAIWADSYPVAFGYQAVPVALDLLGEEVMPLRNEGYTYYNSLKPGYVYGNRDGWYSGVNAIGGTLAGSPYTEAEPMSYNDIDGHWAADILNQLALYEVGWQGGEAKPEDTLTQVDYLELLASSEGYSTTDVDSLYEYAYRRDFLTEKERDEYKPVTRGEMVKLLLDRLGYQEFAGFKGIFRCDFTDADQIPQELMGYAALSQALELVDGGDAAAFAADTGATRCQAAAMLWKYMSK